MTELAQNKAQDDGYMLVGCIVLIFVIMLTLGVAAPTVAREMRREREVESAHRANEYVRAIRVYYRKNGSHYPTSIDQLKNTNNQKYLRKEYIDPLTGKADWRLIHVGENVTTVKGFFGTDLPGIAGASGLSNIGGTSASGSGGAGSTGSAFGSSGTASGSTGSTFGSGSSGSSPGSGSSGSSFGSSGTSSGTGTGTTGSTSGGTSSSSSSPLSGGGGLMMGVGSNKTGEAMLVVNGKDRYEDWEFLYDPRIEALYAKGALNGGGISGSSATSGSGFGSSGSGTSTGGFGSTSGSGTSSGAGTPTTPH